MQVQWLLHRRDGSAASICVVRPSAAHLIVKVRIAALIMLRSSLDHTRCPRPKQNGSSRRSGRSGEASRMIRGTVPITWRPPHRSRDVGLARLTVYPTVSVFAAKSNVWQGV